MAHQAREQLPSLEGRAVSSDGRGNYSFCLVGESPTLPRREVGVPTQDNQVSGQRRSKGPSTLAYLSLLERSKLLLDLTLKALE